MNFEQELRRRTEEADRILNACLPKEAGHQEELLAAMNYSVRAGGKRLRPILIQSVCRMLGGDEASARPFMAALEMIHTHSLIHDDLPALDNDLLRRGKKTTWAAYGEGTAILAGDALLNYAYETALSSVSDTAHQGPDVKYPDADAKRSSAGGTRPDADGTGPGADGTGPSADGARVSTDGAMPGADQTEKRCLRALRILASKTGIYGMLGGQSVDVKMEGKPLTPDQLTFIYSLKTGALLEGAMMIGAALAGAGEETMRRIERIGAQIGMAFQIQDDILDVVGEEARLGKPSGSDEKNQKTTYVTLFGLEKAREEVSRLTEEALMQMDLLAPEVIDEGEAAFLRELFSYLTRRTF